MQTAKQQKIIRLPEKRSQSPLHIIPWKMTMGNYNTPEDINNLLRKGTMIGNSMS
jgi:hypothetical protein